VPETQISLFSETSPTLVNRNIPVSVFAFLASRIS